MRDAVVCEPLRTPVGGYGGVLRDTPAADLATAVVRAVMERTGIPGELVDEVLLGQSYANGEAPAIGRVAALDAGLPVTSVGAQVDRRCGSGLQAVLYAAMEVQTGAADLVLAGGVESMSQGEYYTTAMRWGSRAGDVELVDRLARGRVTAGGARHLVPGGMIETAENLRREYRIGRREQDELALGSHERAVAAQKSGVFVEEIVPVTVRRGREELVVDTDEHPRADTTLEALAALRPIRGRQDPDATVTAGNSSGQNDGAAVCVVTHPDLAKELGLRPLGRLVSWAVAGVEPERMGIGPGPRDRHGPRAGGPAARGRRARAAQRARVRALPRPPGRCHRRPHPLPAAPGDGAPRGALRSRDDVHPEWPGHRSRLRARGLTWQHPGPPGSSINAS